jgi:DDE superfamily endonuclease
MWCVAKLDKEYIARMEEVLAVYEKPLSEHQPVVCVDEKPVVLHQEVRPALAMQPGRVARRDSEYRRCGTANVFCGVEPKAGRHFTQGDRRPLLPRVCRLPAGGGRALPSG